MQNFRPQFTKIKGLSEKRRLPRIGKIRLGIKVRNKGGMTQKCQHEEGQLCIYCSHPIETDYFVVPPDIAERLGDKPKELNVMLPVNDPEVVFPQKLAWYGASKGPKCMGDGEIATRLNDAGVWEERKCPCELYEKECMRRANLMVLLPEVSLAGIYQIDIGSYHSIIDINSGIDYVIALVGRFAMIPLKLKREPRETHADGNKQTHYTLTLTLDATPQMLMALRENTQKVLMGPQYALPAPEDVNPVYDDGPGAVVKDEEKVVDMESKVIKTEGQQVLFEEFNGKKLADQPTLMKQINGRISERKFDREKFKHYLFHEFLPSKGHAKPVGNETLSLKVIPLTIVLQDIMPNWEELEEGCTAWLAKQGGVTPDI